MMKVEHPLYQQDLEQVGKYIFIPDHSSVLVTGATGLIGSFLVDTFLHYNQREDKEIRVTATSRHLQKLKERFLYGLNCNYLKLMEWDAVEEIPEEEDFDYIIHLASNADPRSYALYPAETIITNILGTLNVLNYARSHKKTRVLFTSTFEVYGLIQDTVLLHEDDYGLVDFNQVRSGYPVSKRSAELLIRSYVEEYGIHAVIARLSSIYGPTMTAGDNKAAAQFVRKAIQQENIVLKSNGSQLRSYCYVADAVAGVLTVLCHGNDGEAYNVCNPDCKITIAELAQIAAQVAGTKVVFDLPDDLERKGFSKPQDSVLCADRLIKLGFTPTYSAENGIKRTVKILS